MIDFSNCGKPRAEKSTINKEDETFCDDDTGSLLRAEGCGQGIVFSFIFENAAAKSLDCGAACLGTNSGSLTLGPGVGH